jgi:hypothetical protein
MTWLNIAAIVNPHDAVRHPCKDSGDPPKHLRVIPTHQDDVRALSLHLGDKLEECPDGLRLGPMQRDGRDSGFGEFGE